MYLKGTGIRNQESPKHRDKVFPSVLPYSQTGALLIR